MEKIIDIKETDDKGYVGYKVLTNIKEYYLTIDDYQSCCESYGYFSSNDNLDDFIGAELLKVNLVPTCLSKVILLEKAGEFVSEDECCFVNFETSVGTFQIAVYNSHNGYYGHEIKMKISEKEEVFCA